MNYIRKLIFIPNISMIGSNLAILYINVKSKVFPNRHEKKIGFSKSQLDKPRDDPN